MFVLAGCVTRHFLSPQLLDPFWGYFNPIPEGNEELRGLARVLLETVGRDLEGLNELVESSIGEAEVVLGVFQLLPQVPYFIGGGVDEVGMRLGPSSDGGEERVGEGTQGVHGDVVVKGEGSGNGVGRHRGCFWGNPSGEGGTGGRRNRATRRGRNWLSKKGGSTRPCRDGGVVEGKILRYRRVGRLDGHVGLVVRHLGSVEGAVFTKVSGAEGPMFPSVRLGEVV